MAAAFVGNPGSETPSSAKKVKTYAVDQKIFDIAPSPLELKLLNVIDADSAITTGAEVAAFCDYMSEARTVLDLSPLFMIYL